MPKTSSLLRSIGMPDPFRINHCVRDALTMYQGGIDNPFLRATIAHGLTSAEYDIARIGFDEAIDALWGDVAAQFEAKQFGAVA